MATTQKKNKYTLADSANMLRGLSSGDKSKQVDANGDGKMNLSDVSTMMKFTAGWSPETAMDPYKGKEVTPRDYGKSQEYLLGKVVNREPFEFSGTGSPIYQAYAKQYKREGDLAAKDTLSKVSARTGGVPSSYAVTATAAQQNQYAGAMADKIPELYEMEYNQYTTDAERDRADLNTLLGVKNNDLAYAGAMAEYGDYTGLKGMGVDTSRLETQDAREDADYYYKYGDTSLLKDIGVDLSKMEEDEDLSRAVSMYQITGDTSLLKSLGYDTSYLEKQIDQQNAEYYMALFQNTGDTRYLQMIDPNMDLSKILRDKELAEAEIKASIGDYSGYDALGFNTSYAKQAQTKALSSGKYSSTDHSAMATKISMGPLYWDDSVKKYSRSVFGMEPIDVYFASNLEDENGPTGEAYYDVLSEALEEIGNPIRISSPEEWARSSEDYRNSVLKRWNATSYEDFLRKVAYKYL